MTVSDPLGARMKAYEHTQRHTLPRRSYTIVRVDGRCFHTVLRNAERPFDWEVMDLMGEVTRALCMDLSGAEVAYTQSDEISILLTDFDTVGTEPHFGGVVQKIASTAAATATAAWGKGVQLGASPQVIDEWAGATFDARVFQIPDRVEVVNYFLWRQRDAKRNALQMVARSMYSHDEIKGLNQGELHNKLGQEKGVIFNRDYPPAARMGRICVRSIFSPPGECNWGIEPAREIQARPDNWFALKVPRPNAFDDVATPDTRMVYPTWCRCAGNGNCKGHSEMMHPWQRHRMESLDQPAPHPHGRFGGPPTVHVADNPDLGEPYL